MDRIPPFLQLPPELRNRIYHELLTTSPPHIFDLSKGHMEPAILSVNRQLRSECSGIFYAHTKLQFRDPEICLRRLSTLPAKHVALIPELRYDTSQTCTSASSWRTVFRQLPGLDEDTKLEHLRDALFKEGISLRPGVLKAKILIGCGPSWTSDPLSAALDAVKQGMMVERMMYM